MIRHASVYEPTHGEAELAERLTGARKFLPDAFEVLRASIIAARPGSKRD